VWENGEEKNIYMTVGIGFVKYIDKNLLVIVDITNRRGINFSLGFLNI